MTGLVSRARRRSKSVRAQPIQDAPVASATLSRAVTRPPLPRRNRERPAGSYGARLLTMIGDQRPSWLAAIDRMASAVSSVGTAAAIVPAILAHRPAIQPGCRPTDEFWAPRPEGDGPPERVAALPDPRERLLERGLGLVEGAHHPVAMDEQTAPMLGEVVAKRLGRGNHQVVPTCRRLLQHLSGGQSTGTIPPDRLFWHWQAHRGQGAPRSTGCTR